VSLRIKARPYQDDIASMIGMDGVADQVDALVNQAVVAQQRKAAGYKTDDRPMHLIFEGNPGTGKTTIANKIAPLYKDLGLVSKPTVLELKKGDITGPFNNQVEEHTYNALMKGKGGVIFIDEAYMLNNDEEGRKAIDAMVPILSDPKFSKDTVVILAGYPGKMQAFLDVNEGLADRFSDRVRFRDYTAPELHQIAQKMINDQEYAVSASTNREIGKAVAAIASKPGHANGRSVARLIDRIKRAHEARLGDDPTPDELRFLTAADVQSAMKAQGLDAAA
jgi:stage V sporulation protein K